MAESAANFTFIPQNKPSIYDIIAQKSLDDTLHPALQKLALFLATNIPKQCNWLSQYYDEVYLLLSGVLQYHYLKSYDSTFSENFYGLKRVAFGDSKLTDNHRHLSLVFSVLLPYIQRKIDERAALYRLHEADYGFRNNFSDNCKKLLIISHSTFQICWNLTTVYTYINFMSGQSEIQLPVQHLIRLKLAYSDPELEGPTFWGTLLSGQFRDLWKINLLQGALSSTFEIGAFFLQFLQSWQANRSNFSITALPSVKTPPCDGRAPGFRNKCPLCYQHWKIPTVLPVSGYVFCFPCIFRYLREKETCPVTNLPAKPLDCVRIFED